MIDTSEVIHAMDLLTASFWLGKNTTLPVGGARSLLPPTVTS